MNKIFTYSIVLIVLVTSLFLIQKNSGVSLTGGFVMSNDIVKVGDKVEVNYEGTLKDGSVFDSSFDADRTLIFTVGAKEVIAGFDNAVTGMKVGEEKTVTIPSAQAYGDYNAALVQEVQVPLNQFVDAKITPEVGMVLQTAYGNLEVVTIGTENVTAKLDANHPLSGQDLTFRIKLEKILLTE